MFEQDGQALYFGVTPVENIFLNEYMPTAKGEYVKVYLMGLYHSTKRDENVGVPEIAKELDMQVSEVEAALRYWERRALVTRLAGEPARYVFYCIAQRVLTGQDQAPRTDDAYVAFAESVYALFGDKRKVRPNEIALAYEWVQDMELSPEAVLMLLNHLLMTSGVQFSFKRAQSLAAKMHDEGVTTCDDAEAFLRFEGEIRQGAQDVLRRMSKRRAPTEDELALYKKWRHTWNFERDAILSACAAMTAGDPSFKYLDGILSRKFEQSTARTGDQMEQELKSDRDESQRVREFRDALGVNAAIPSVLPVYREMVKHMPERVVLLAANECKSVGAHTLDSVQKLLNAWEEKGLTTFEAADEYVKRLHAQNAFLQKIYDACGHAGRPNAPDRELLEAWRAQGASDELILYAAAQASGAEGAKMRYVKKVIESWLSEGVKTPQDAQTQHLGGANREPKQKVVSAQRYQQRDYSEDELERAAGTEELLKEASRINDR